MTMRIITGPATQQNTAAWLAWRANGIGASEAPAIMGTSKFRTAYELFRLRRGIGPPPPPNPFLDRIRARGHLLEPIARRAYERHTGTTVTPIIAESSIYPFIRASFDGYNAFDAIPVEIKCPGDTAHALAMKGIVPPEYFDQVQQQIFVAEAQFAHYYSFDGEKGVLLKVPRNQKRIDQILRGDHEFWHRLQTGKWASDEWVAAATAWQSAHRELQEALAREEQARNVLLTQLPLGRKRHEGNGVSVLLSQRKGQVDWRKLLADKGIKISEDQIDRYRKPATENAIVRDTQGNSNIPSANVPGSSATPPALHPGTKSSKPFDSMVDVDPKIDLIF